MAVVELSPGDTLGPSADGSCRYEILQVLGAGGFGITYLARDRRLQGEVVLKELACSDIAFRDSATGEVRPARGQTEHHRKMVDRFVREARLLNRLRNPHIVRVTDVWQERGTAYYSMDLVDAPSHLGAANADGVTTQSWSNVTTHVTQLLSALEAVHDAGMVHGDVKPANVLLDSRRGVVLIDFGTARDGSEFFATVTSTSFTRGYAPPELMHPSRVREAGPWSDIYSWGMLVWGLVLAHPGERGRPVDAFARSQSFDPYVDPAGQLAAAGVPDAWATVVGRCISLAPHERPKSIAEIRGVLNLPATPSKQAATSSGSIVYGDKESSAVAFDPTQTQSDDGSTVFPASLHQPMTTPSDNAPPMPLMPVRDPSRGRAVVPPAHRKRWPWAVAVLACCLLIVAYVAKPAPSPAAVDGDEQAEITSSDDGCDDCDPTEACVNDRCVPSPSAAAEAAYRASLLAWNEHDSKNYFEAYHEPIPCFYDRANLSHNELRIGRGRHFAFADGSTFEVDELASTVQSDGSVVIHDEGRFVTLDGREKPHNRRIVLTTDNDGVYRIAIEVNSTANACAPHLFAGQE